VGGSWLFDGGYAGVAVSRFASDYHVPGIEAAATSTHRNAEGLALAARFMLTQRDATVIDSLPGIKVPALVIVGAEDKPFLAAADYMAEKIPGAQKIVIPAAGHAVNLDQPETFNAAVLRFLEGLAA